MRARAHTLTVTAVGWTRVSAETMAVAAAFMVSTLLLFAPLILLVSFRSGATFIVIVLFQSREREEKARFQR